MDMHTFWCRRLDRIKRRRLRAQNEEKASKGDVVAYDVVCRYWLAAKCLMGESCPFLHKYIPEKIPLCAYIGAKCVNGSACMFRHSYNVGERPCRAFAQTARVNTAPIMASINKSGFNHFTSNGCLPP